MLEDPADCHRPSSSFQGRSAFYIGQALRKWHREFFDNTEHALKRSENDLRRITECQNCVDTRDLMSIRCGQMVKKI